MSTLFWVLFAPKRARFPMDNVECSHPCVKANDDVNVGVMRWWDADA